MALPQEGKLRADLNLNVAVALLMGPMIYRVAMKLLRMPLPSDMADRVVDAFWKAHRAERPQKDPGRHGRRT